VGTKDSWAKLVDMYGVLRNGISQVRLQQPQLDYEVVGAVSFNPTDDSQLIFNVDIDTKPTNTMAAINAIIDPQKVSADLITSPNTGTRYLLLHDIGSFANVPGSGAVAWRGSDGMDLVAHANDIIEYTGAHWAVMFDSGSASGPDYVSNLTTGTQYRWDGVNWLKSYEGEYKAGLWTLVL
jgi:hypothetical protein